MIYSEIRAATLIPLKRRNARFCVFLPGCVFPQRPSSSLSKKWRQNDSIFLKYFLFSIIYFLFYTIFIFFVFFYFFSQWNVSLRFFTGTYMGWYMAAKKGLLGAKFFQSHNKNTYAGGSSCLPFRFQWEIEMYCISTSQILNILGHFWLPRLVNDSKLIYIF